LIDGPGAMKRPSLLRRRVKGQGFEPFFCRSERARSAHDA
jgi:hypothetical protein